MATKPSKFPEWASNNDSLITEPETVKKKAGWIGEVPPCEWFNWWQNLVYKWVVWFEEKVEAVVLSIATHSTNIENLTAQKANKPTVVNLPITFTGFTSNVSVNGYILAESGIISDKTIVKLFIPEVSGTSNSATLVAEAVINEAYQPSNSIRRSCIVKNNNTREPGAIEINTAGDIILTRERIHYSDVNENPQWMDIGPWFDTTGTKGFYAQVIEYIIDTPED